MLWAPEALAAAGALPEPLRREIRDLLAAVATGPLPPHEAIPDLDLAHIYHLRTAHTAVVAGVYDDEVRVWLVRTDT